jgi:sec-independent protein translocase protein TatA
VEPTQLISLLMSRRMLRGIKERAEAADPQQRHFRCRLVRERRNASGRPQAARLIRATSWSRHTRNVPSRTDLAMANIGPAELIVVLVIALVVLGPKRLPEAGKSLGKGLREFKDALSEDRTRGDDRPLAEHASAPRGEDDR